MDKKFIIIIITGLIFALSSQTWSQPKQPREKTAADLFLESCLIDNGDTAQSKTQVACCSGSICVICDKNGGPCNMVPRGKSRAIELIRKSSMNHSPGTMAPRNSKKTAPSIRDHRSNNRDHRSNKVSVRKDSTVRSNPPPRRHTRPGTVDHRRDQQRAINQVHQYAVWMIGANKKGVVDAVISPGANPGSYYNLKGLQNRKFLQYERQGAGRGINIGWTDNASANTAQKSSRWVFVPKEQSRRVNDKGNGTTIRDKSVRYGEKIAIAWAPKNKDSGKWDKTRDVKFIKYSRRNTGINLDWSGKPAYEWTILGGKPGERVDRGVDKVIIYNLVNKQPLVYFPRNIGGHIGWPNSKDDIGLSTTILPPSPPHSVFKSLMMNDARRS